MPVRQGGVLYMHKQARIQPLASEVLAQLRSIDSCTVSNAIERFDVRPRNEGFTDSSVRCFSPGLPPMVGYAAPGRMRSSAAPPSSKHWYYKRLDWWEYLTTLPAPRVIVIEDMDECPGMGALFGEIHARIATALGCVGYVTNGAVRDLPAIGNSLHLFASAVAVSHAYAHVVDFGEPVEIGRLRIKPGDLLHGDLHGIVAVPEEVADRVPQEAARLLAEERELIGMCHPGNNFSLDKLRAYLGTRE